MAAIAAQPPLKTWTRAELEALEAAGFLEDLRLELIDGEVFDKMGQNPPHASAIVRLSSALQKIFDSEQIRTQLPVEPAEEERQRSLPEPDVVVVRGPETAYRHRHPGPADVLLIAEICDTTYSHDAKRKAKLYARAGYAEYILLDLNEQELVVFQAPRRGVYTEMHILRSGDQFHPLCSPEYAIPVSYLLGQ